MYSINSKKLALCDQLVAVSPPLGCGLAQPLCMIMQVRVSGQPDDPNSIGTLMVCVAAHAPPPGASRHTASLVRWTARASHPPPGPGASVAVAGGSAGSRRHGPAAAAMVSA